MRLLKIPIYVVAWYADRLRRIATKDVPGWALAEVVCMSLSLMSVLLLAGLVVLRLAEVAYPAWLLGCVLPLLLGASCLVAAMGNRAVLDRLATYRVRERDAVSQE